MSVRKPRRRAQTKKVTLIPERELRKYLAEQGNDPATIDYIVAQIPNYLGMHHNGEKVWTKCQIRTGLQKLQRLADAKESIKKALKEEA